MSWRSVVKQDHVKRPTIYLWYTHTRYRYYYARGTEKTCLRDSSDTWTDAHICKEVRYTDHTLTIIMKSTVWYTLCYILFSWISRKLEIIVYWITLSVWEQPNWSLIFFISCFVISFTRITAGCHQHELLLQNAPGGRTTHSLYVSLISFYQSHSTFRSLAISLPPSLIALPLYMTLSLAVNWIIITA